MNFYVFSTATQDGLWRETGRKPKRNGNDEPERRTSNRKLYRNERLKPFLDRVLYSLYRIPMKNLILLLFVCVSSFSQDLTTIAEKSQWLKTGRAEETENLCKGFAKKYAKRVSCKSYGVTPEGRTLWYLRIQDAKAKTSAPTVWIQAGIHAGEIDGKDATFSLMKKRIGEKNNPSTSNQS